MLKHHPKNERVKRKYFQFLKDAKGQSEASIDCVAKAVSRFEMYTHWRDFKAFHFEQAIGFKSYLAKQRNQTTGKPLSKATLNATLRALKSFFQWLSREPGYKSRLNYSEMEYFNLSEKDTRIATAKRQTQSPTIEQITHALSRMPADSVIQRRNRALFAFVLLTGARDSAVVSFKLKHVDLSSGSVFQDAREVNTKASKTFTTFFFPIDDEIRQLFVDWVVYLRDELLWGNDDPLFPRTRIGKGRLNDFEPLGVAREHWRTADPVRKLFRETFEAAGLPYFNPHSFRNTLASLGEKTCKTPEQFKAWSQNLGHSGVLTTFYSYGEVQQTRQAEIFAAMQKPCSDNQVTDTDQIAEAVLRKMQAQGMVSRSAV